MRKSISEVFGLAWPMVLGMLSYTIIDLTDTAMVGWLGTTELAGVGAATTGTFFLYAFFIGFFESIKILVSQATGAERGDLVQLGGWQGIFLALPCGLFMCLLPFWSVEFFQIFGGSLEVQKIATEYFNIRVYGSVLWFVMLSLVSFYQGMGDTKTPMYVNMCICAVNVVLDFILIKSFGTAGAAYATITAQAVGAVVMITLFFRKFGWTPEFSKPICKKLIKVGWPVGIRWMLDHGAWGIMAAFIAHMGDAQFAANQVALIIMRLSILPIYGLAEAACVLAGQKVGAGKISAVSQIFKATMLLACVFSILSGAIFVYIPDYLISLFNSDLDVIQIGAGLMTMVALFQLAEAIEFVLGGVLNGTGDTKFTMYGSIINTWVCSLPASWLIGVYFEWQAYGIWLACAVCMFGLALAMYIRFCSSAWRDKVLVEAG